jgi:hypothetical protein
MGEYADMAIDSMLAADEYYLDNFGEYDDGEPCFSPFTRRRGPQPKTCRSCGKTNLLWERNDFRWYLVQYDHELDEFKPHQCSHSFKSRIGRSSR